MVRLVALALGIVVAALVWQLAPASAQTMDDIAGSWWRHGFILRVNQDGSAEATWRTYQWCGDPGVTGACDAQRNHEIINGGRAEISFSNVAIPGAPRDWSPRVFAAPNRQPVFRDVQLAVATGVVLSSTQEERLRIGPVDLVKLPYGTATLVQDGDGFLLCDLAFDAPPEARGHRLCGA